VQAARAAFTEATTRVPAHAMARAALAIVDPHRESAAAPTMDAPMSSFDAAEARAVALAAAGDATGAARVIAAALRSAPPGNAGWLVPIEPLLGVSQARAAWAPVLAALRTRAS
jgi:hypothetical protein